MSNATPRKRGRAGDASFDGLLRAFAYPLQSAALTSILAFSLALMLGSLPVVGTALSLVVWASAYRYAIEVLDRSAAGAMEAPEHVLDVRAGGGVAMLVLQLTFLALYFVVELWVPDKTSRLGWWLLLAMIQPAATLNLVLIGNVESAVNPLRWLQLIGRVGFGYVLLVVVGAACHFLRSEAQEFLYAWLPTIAARVLAGFIGLYLLVFNFHLMGRIVYARRGAIGHDLAEVPTRLDPTDRHRSFMREMEIMIAEDNGKQAAASIRRHLESEPHTTDAMHQRYRRLLEQLGDVAALGEHAQTYVSRLLGEKRERDALAAVRSMLQHDPSFRVRDVEQRVRLARSAMNCAMADVAQALAADFHGAHPRNAAVPEMALLGARLLVDRDSNLRAARDLLQFAADRCPDDPRQPEIFLKIEQVDALEARLAP